MHPVKQEKATFIRTKSVVERRVPRVDQGQSQRGYRYYTVMGIKTAALHMRQTSIISIFLALLAFLTLTTKTGIAQIAPSERGQVIAEKHCARCHAIGSAGNSPMGLAPPFLDLSQRYPIETLAEALAEGIVTGHPAMHFTFHPREIDAFSLI